MTNPCSLRILKIEGEYLARPHPDKIVILTHFVSFGLLCRRRRRRRRRHSGGGVAVQARAGRNIVRGPHRPVRAASTSELIRQTRFCCCGFCLSFVFCCFCLFSFVFVFCYVSIPPHIDYTRGFSSTEIIRRRTFFSLLEGRQKTCP